MGLPSCSAARDCLLGRSWDRFSGRLAALAGAVPDRDPRSATAREIAVDARDGLSALRYCGGTRACMARRHAR